MKLALQKLEQAIHATPTGPTRELLTEVNILIQAEMNQIKAEMAAKVHEISVVRYHNKKLNKRVASLKANIQHLCTSVQAIAEEWYEVAGCGNHRDRIKVQLHKYIAAS